MSSLLFNACTESVIAATGKTDSELVGKLYNYIHDNYEKNSKPWNYEIIDTLIAKWAKPVEFRDLDGVYFRVERNGKWGNICFSDLSEVEMEQVLENKDADYLKRLCKVLGTTLRGVGDQLNVIRKAREEE